MRDDNELPEALRRPTELLRTVPHVRNEWRRNLQVRLDSGAPDVDALATADVPRWRARRWNVSIPSAIAACLVCMLVGAVGARLVPRTPSAVAESSTLASAPVMPVSFDLVAPGATHVTIVGDFNKWNPEALPMRRSGDGKRWEVEVRLPPGRYTYGFVVDGQLTRDPAAPQTASDDFGIPNSVLMVSQRGGST